MISAVVLTKNEENNIGECLKRLQWCDEIIVVDDHSTDETREIAQKLGAKVFQRSLNNDFASQRNFALRQARGEWVFFVDADERITDALASEVLSNYNGFYIKRRDFMWGRELRHGETGNIKLLRLAKKGTGEWRRPVHEVWEVEGKIGELRNPLLHFPHQTIGEFLKEINFYSTLDAQEFFRQGKKVGFGQILAYPPGKFLVNFFLKLGFLDGIPGFLMAMIMSFHSFLVRGKLWHLWIKKFS